MYDDHVTFFKHFPGSTSRPNFGKLGNSKNPFSMHHPIRLFDLFGRYEPSRIPEEWAEVILVVGWDKRPHPPKITGGEAFITSISEEWTKCDFCVFQLFFFLGGFDSLNKKITQAWLWNRCFWGEGWVQGGPNIICWNSNMDWFFFFAYICEVKA